MQEKSLNSSKYRIIIINTIIFALGNLGSKLILFFLVPLYTRYLTSAEFGVSDLIMTLSSLLLPIMSLSISSSVLRFGMKKEYAIDSVLSTSMAIATLSAVFMLMMNPFFKVYGAIYPWRWYLIAITILSNYLEIGKSCLKAENQNRLFAELSVIQTLAICLLNIILIKNFDMGITGYLASNVGALAISIIITFTIGGLIKKINIHNYNTELSKMMLRYSIPLIISNVSWWIISSSDKVLIELELGASSLGIYTTATKIPSLMNVLLSVFIQAWNLSAIQERENNSKGFNSLYNKVFEAFCILMCGSAILVISFIKYFMLFYVSDDYYGAWIYIPLLIVAAVFYAFSGYLGSVYSALQKTSHDMWTSLIGSIVNIIITYYGVKILGIFGAVIGTVISYYLCYFLRKIDIGRFSIKTSFERSNYVNILLVMFCAIITMISQHEYYYNLLIIIFYYIYNRKKINVIIENVKYSLNYKK